jgi:hypothetical protein
MRKNKSLFLMFGVILVLALVQLACNMPDNDPPTQESPGLIHTIAAQTVEAQLTQQAGGVFPTQPGPTAAPTNTQAPGTNPTATQSPPASTAAPTSMFTATPTATTVACNKLTFVKDITVPDNTEFEPGESFDKTWRLRNSGSCNWTSSYSIVFTDGDRMDAPESQAITTGTVAPGQEIDVTVELQAPDDPGTYQGYFKLESDNGVEFGYGNDSRAFWVKIEVPEPSGTMFDFIDEADNAEWGSGIVPVEYDKPGETVLTFGGPDNDSDGFAMVKRNVELENGRDYAKVLETHPKWDYKGYIVGKFPTYTVRSGDRLVGAMGFLAKTDGTCGDGDAIFEIFYTIDDDLDEMGKLGKWEETCDGKLQIIDLDLSSIRGEDVEFYLVIRANGDSSQDWAVWQGLAIER